MTTYQAEYQQVVDSIVTAEIKFLWWGNTADQDLKPAYRQQRQAGIDGGELIYLGSPPRIFTSNVGIETAKKATLEAMVNTTGKIRIFEADAGFFDVKLLSIDKIQGIGKSVTVDADNVQIVTYTDYEYNVTFARES